MKNSYYESLLEALADPEQNLELCQDDYEALEAYLAAQRHEATFGHQLVYESQGGWGE